MGMNRLLIDTNIYSDALRGKKDVVLNLRKAELIGISTISIGELFSGFMGGKKERRNRMELDEFLDSPRVEMSPQILFCLQYHYSLNRQGRSSHIQQEGHTDGSRSLLL
jgi:tRNA(fMet)-specific endonuclease VapC